MLFQLFIVSLGSEHRIHVHRGESEKQREFRYDTSIFCKCIGRISLGLMGFQSRVSRIAWYWGQGPGALTHCRVGSQQELRRWPMPAGNGQEHYSAERPSAFHYFLERREYRQIGTEENRERRTCEDTVGTGSGIRIN